ncbi:MAG: hypothetical protein P1U56_20390 [Saprospiraceae bacterium]|nr:hypothetical protein [Saprospiraceae bacterium]
MDKESGSFEIRDSSLNGVIDIILVGYIIIVVVCLFFSLKYLFEGNIRGVIMVFSFIILLIYSIYAVIKLTGAKSLHLLDRGLQIDYSKFNRALIKRVIDWDDILLCEITQNTTPAYYTESHRIVLILKKNKSIIIGKEVSKELAVKIKGVIQQKIGVYN